MRPRQSEDLFEVATHLVLFLGTRGIIARVFGGVAIAHSTQWNERFGVDRQTKDLDMVVAKGQMLRATEVLAGTGWVVDTRSIMFNEQKRVLLHRRHDGLALDVFSDPLEFNQTVSLGDRLVLCPVTLTPADLLLTKLQIFAATRLDLVDIVAIVTQPGNLEQFNVLRHVVDICSSDWKMYHSALVNLENACLLVDRSPIVAEQNALPKLRQFISRLEDSPKSTNWRIRSKFGTRIAWYSHVD